MPLWICGVAPVDLGVPPSFIVCFLLIITGKAKPQWLFILVHEFFCSECFPQVILGVPLLCFSNASPISLQTIYLFRCITKVHLPNTYKSLTKFVPFKKKKVVTLIILRV